MVSACVFPEELLQRPRPLIFLSGLDKNIKTHRNIWETFNSDPRKSYLSFKLVDYHFEVPKSKTKRTSYEWYIPKGILKCNWIDKHLNKLPSVIAVFSDLNWDEGGRHLEGIKSECVSRVEHIRHTLQGHHTKIVLVLIQKRTILPPGEDSVATDYAQQLCEACNIPTRSLFVLPLSEDTVIDGFIKRLHEELLALAVTYYQNQVRVVKSHKDYLNKTTHGLLFVRHAFKIAFFTEMQANPAKSPDSNTNKVLGYYKQAYEYLTGGMVRVYETNLLEVKTVGGFLNYKICKLYFQGNQPLQAISQFKRMVDWFKPKQGPQELVFEHYAWLYRQFSIFAELFEEAVQIGLQAYQQQHPGFYYQQAAHFTMKRRHHAALVAPPNQERVSVSQTETDNSGGVLEFWGQRLWRQGYQSIEPPDATKEKAGILHLQQQERLINYSSIVIPLLNSAVCQFKKFKCAKMKRWLIVQIGEEYLLSQEHSKALKYFLKVLPEYRSEGWPEIFSNILVMALNSAYLIADVESFTALSIEIMGCYCCSSVDFKRTVQMNLAQVFAQSVPHADPNLPRDQVDIAGRMWHEVLNNSNRDSPLEPFVIDMSGITSFITIKCVFTKNKFCADEPLVMKVYLHSVAQFPIRFSKLSLHFSNPNYDSFCVIVDPLQVSQAGPTGDASSQDTSIGSRGSVADLSINPGELKMFTFQFYLAKTDVGKKLEIRKLVLQLGQSSASTHCALLEWLGAETKPHLLDQVQLQNELPQQFNSKPSVISTLGSLPIETCMADMKDILQIPSRPSCDSRLRESKVLINVDHQPPVLVNEWYKLDITIENCESSPITKVEVQIKFKTSQDDTRLSNSNRDSSSRGAFPQLCLDWTAQDDDLRISQINRDFPDPIEPGEKINLCMYIRCFQEADEILQVKVVHGVEIETHHFDATSEKSASLDCACCKDDEVLLMVVRPFDMVSRATTMTMDPLETIHGQEKFLIMTTVKAVSPWPVLISTGSFELNPQVTKIEETEGALDNILLKPREAANIICAAKTTPMALPSTLDLGKLLIKWRRNPIDPDLPIVCSSLDISPLHNVDPVPISIRADVPAFGHVHQPIHLRYHITNNTDILQEITMQTESADSGNNMLFSGNKSLQCRLLPRSTKVINYTVIPIAVGFCKLPTFNMYLIRLNKEMAKLVKQSTPTELFVKPAHTFTVPLDE